MGLSSVAAIAVLMIVRTRKNVPTASAAQALDMLASRGCP
jgi:hypothetical protein